MSGELAKCMREKHWSEIGADQKIERMRKEVRRLLVRVESLVCMMDTMKQHRHLGGEIVTPIATEHRGTWDRSDGDDVYF